ncbi:MAG: FkbM family methyltransferase [Candidatus Binatia bacterium]
MLVTMSDRVFHEPLPEDAGRTGDGREGASSSRDRWGGHDGRFTACLFPHDSGVTLVLPGDELRLAWRAHHEPFLRQFVAALLATRVAPSDPAACILDAGAWIGDNALPWATILSLTTSKRRGHLTQEAGAEDMTLRSSVLAIEPNPRHCALMDRVAIANGIDANLVTVCSALADRTGELVTSGDLDHCAFEPGVVEPEMAGTPNARTRVPCTTIDALCCGNSPRRLFLVHLDVEGLESQALRGGNATLRRDRPIVIFEAHLRRQEAALRDCVTFLGSIDYDIYVMTDPLEGNYDDSRNVLAMPDDRSLGDILATLERSTRAVVVRHSHGVFHTTRFTSEDAAIAEVRRRQGGPFACVAVRHQAAGTLHARPIAPDRPLASCGESTWVQACLAYAKDTSVTRAPLRKIAEGEDLASMARSILSGQD